MPDTGPRAAAAVINDVFDWGPPKILLFVGCAGEIAAKHRTAPLKPLVVVARLVVDRDPSVIGPAGPDYGMEGYWASGELLTWVRSLVVSNSFQDLDVRTDKDVASGSSFVLDDQSPEHKAIVNRYGSEVLFVEMEGVGGFHHIQAQRHKAPDLVYGLIKGIADKADPHATQDKDTRQRRATLHAAQVAFRFLETFDR
jgi:nucleoside phosphorylase